MYYLLDNIIWLSLKKYKLLSKMKDFFSFTRWILEICKWIYEMNKDFNHEKKILKRLRSYERFLASDKDESYLLIQDLIKLRRQMNFYMLDLITNVFRGIMLFKSLSLYGSIYLDPIFVEFWGVIGNFFALLKSIKKRYISKEQRKVNFIKSKISSKFINWSYSNELFQNYLGNGYIRHPKFTSFNHTKFGAPIAKIASTRESSSSLNST